MLDFKWLRRKDKPDEVIIRLPNGGSVAWLNYELQNQIVRTAAEAIVAEYGKEIIEGLLGKKAFDEAIKTAVAKRVMGDPSRLR